MLAIDLFKPDPDPWLGLVAHELDGIRDQILHYLNDARAVHMDERKDRIHLHINLLRFKYPLRCLERVPYDLIEGNIGVG